MGRTKKLPWKREYNTVVDECTTNTKSRAEGQAGWGERIRKEIGMAGKTESWME
jgi:hypothetical protein